MQVYSADIGRQQFVPVPGMAGFVDYRGSKEHIYGS